MDDSTASSSPFGFDVETVTGNPTVAPSSFVGIGKLAAAMFGPIDNGGGDGPFTHTYTPSWSSEEEVDVEAFQRLPGKTVSSVRAVSIDDGVRGRPSYDVREVQRLEIEFEDGTVLTITAQADSHSHMDEQWLEWELDVPLSAAPVPLPNATSDDANPGVS
jgi:hypothetical protein